MLLCAFLEKSRRPPLVRESLVCQLASSQFLTDFSLPAASSPLTFVFKTSLIDQFLFYLSFLNISSCSVIRRIAPFSRITASNCRSISSFIRLKVRCTFKICGEVNLTWHEKGQCQSFYHEILLSLNPRKTPPRRKECRKFELLPF